MNLRNQFNRIGHLFGDGMEKTQKATEHWADQGGKQANEMARQVREQVDTGSRNIITAEESIVRHVRENPALYLMAAALLIGVLIAKLIIESREMRRAPLL